jgi:hypothetical protein
MVFSNMLSAFQKTKLVASLRAALRKSGNDFGLDDGGAHAPRVPFPAPSLETSEECVRRGGCTPYSTIRNPNSKLETGRRTLATVRHSSAPKTGATCKRNLRQLDFEVFVATTILD